MLRFALDHAVWLLLLPLAVVGATAVHEGAHAAAVLVAGGDIVSIDVWPGGESEFQFGEVTYDLGGRREPWWVALAPTLVWTTLAAATAAVGFATFRAGVPARLALLAGFFLPIVDASLAAAALFRARPTSDWYQALHGLEPLVAFAFAAYVAVLGEVGLRLFRRAWGTDALSSTEYVCVYLAVLALPWLRFAPWPG
jgi:hypothetical protein